MSKGPALTQTCAPLSNLSPAVGGSRRKQGFLSLLSCWGPLGGPV